MITPLYENENIVMSHYQRPSILECPKKVLPKPIKNEKVVIMIKAIFSYRNFGVWVGEMLYVSIRIKNLEILKVNNSRDIYENHQKHDIMVGKCCLIRYGTN